MNSAITNAGATTRTRTHWLRNTILAVGAGLLVLLSVINLTAFPQTWYDEGSHLHVPKALVKFGVYADYSSEGFRYYGPAIGVGPTVLLPVAASFKLFGIGLAQARLVMVAYLLIAVVVFFLFARHLLGNRFAALATALLVTSPAVGMLEYGRQLLGEVPALLFMIAALWLWFRSWDRQTATWPRLLIVGLLFGLSVITKNQFLIGIAPMFAVAWLANLVYYRLTPQRVFIVPALTAMAIFGAWQLLLVLFLGPSNASENLAALRQATSGAALAFSPTLIRQSLGEVLSIGTYFALLVPALLYSLFLALGRRRENQQWGVLVTIAGVNLIWYVVASVGWPRYAFPGFALGALFVGRMFFDLTDGLSLKLGDAIQALRERSVGWPKHVLRFAALAVAALMLIASFGRVALNVVRPPASDPQTMAAYMNANVPPDAVVETWEPEMGFLTDHRYHYPPQKLLYDAVDYMWRDGQPPSQLYDYVQKQRPDYVLRGKFSAWVDLYASDILERDYVLQNQTDAYELFARRDIAAR